MPGTEMSVTVDRVVDGDTVRVFLNEGDEKSESLRILSLDTEEVNPGSKPATPLGKMASDRAKELIKEGDTVKLTFPGTEPVEVAIKKYRGNFGRLLVYLSLSDGTDFQEQMIREGLSPYFSKYGFAEFEHLHSSYVDAERAAQADHLGVWDQITHNGSEMRNYAALCTWWELRARIIEGYREVKRWAPQSNLFNTRLDYAQLVEIAKAKQETTVFMELRNFFPAEEHIIFTTGSNEQPFNLFVPNGNEGGGNEVMNLLLSRYVAEGEEKPRRSYAYVTGPTKMFPDNETGRPEIIVTDPAQISDRPSAAIDRALLRL